ncbi:MAG: hypothetical protein SNF73_07020 [Rikenellaceae bacterium]
MKTNFRKFFSVLAVAAMVSTAVLTSCSDDEVTPIPDEVESTIENAYYITGIVTTADGVLSGATVSSGSESATTDLDGVYKLTMSSASKATVTFSKDGYISIDATAIFASDATAGAAVTLSQELTAQAASQTATAGEDATLSFYYDSDSDIVLSIPSTSLTESTDISATSYTPTATESAATSLASVTDGGTTTVVSALSAVYLTPSGTTFETPITIYIPGEYVEGAYHAKLVDGEWEKQGDASYDTATNSYVIEVSGFSQHSIAVESIVSTSSSSSSSTITLASETIKNIGNVDALTQSISYSQKSGWEISGNSLVSYVAGIMGCSSNVSEIAQSLDVTAAGDENVTVTITQQVTSTTFTVGSTSATATSYGDVTVSITTEQGDMRPDHN